MSNEIEFAPHEVEAKTCTKVNRAEQHVYECGCIGCLYGDMDRCGAQSCGQPGHSKLCCWRQIRDCRRTQGRSETFAELKADRDRLRRELDDTKAQLEACEIWRDKLRIEAAKARQSCTKCPNCDRLQRELDEVRATIQRFVQDWMEPVTETRAQVAKGKP